MPILRVLTELLEEMNTLDHNVSSTLVTRSGSIPLVGVNKKNKGPSEFLTNLLLAVSIKSRMPMVPLTIPKHF